MVPRIVVPASYICTDFCSLFLVIHEGSEDREERQHALISPHAGICFEAHLEEPASQRTQCCTTGTSSTVQGISSARSESSRQHSDVRVATFALTRFQGLDFKEKSKEVSHT